jgi:hypothetical protein
MRKSCSGPYYNSSVIDRIFDWLSLCVDNIRTKDSWPLSLGWSATSTSWSQDPERKTWSHPARRKESPDFSVLECKVRYFDLLFLTPCNSAPTYKQIFNDCSASAATIPLYSTLLSAALPRLSAYPTKNSSSAILEGSLFCLTIRSHGAFVEHLDDDLLEPFHLRSCERFLQKLIENSCWKCRFTFLYALINQEETSEWGMGWQ